MTDLVEQVIDAARAYRDAVRRWKRRGSGHDLMFAREAEVFRALARLEREEKARGFVRDGHGAGRGAPTSK